jgi:hypothetical protein
MANVETLKQEDYLKSDNDRLAGGAANDIANMGDPDDMMLALMGVLTDTEVAPSVGRYYTFIYKADTPEILYDQFPLIACVGVYPWGFRGLNYHWGEFRNYTWEELQSFLYLIYPNELEEARSIPYQKFVLNN